MSLSTVRVNVIVGATGAGKTTTILHLLEQRPAHERWAVLVNDFGTATFDRAQGLAQRAVFIREVAGCICCTGQLALRTSLVALIREARPQRLLIEASSAAEPAQIVSVLHEPGIAKAVDVRATLAVISARQVLDVRYARDAKYRAQLAAGAALVLTDSEAAGEKSVAAALDRLKTLTSPQAIFIENTDRLDRDVLDL